MIFDYSRLRGRIYEKYSTQNEFVRALGCSNTTFSTKMNNKVKFTSADIIKMVELLDIRKEEIGEYFFTLKV